MRKILLVANVAKEHVIKFHIPTIKMLRDNGWIVDVACSGKDKVPYCNNQFEVSYERASINGNLLKGIKELKRIVDAGNYNLVYCHTTTGGVAGRLASRNARKKGTKVIYLSHGYFFYRGCPAYYWPTFYLAEKLLSFFTDAIIAINDEDYEISKKHFRRCKIYKINGIGVDYSKLQVENPNSAKSDCRAEIGVPQEATELIYLAELHGNKNQPFLMRVAKDLLEKKEDVYLVLAGYDHVNGEYQKLAREMGIANRVIFLGWRDDIGRLYSTADICTATSIREGFGLNLVEAMACGIPVVATKNRGHSSIIQDGKNGFLVDQGDETGFVQKVRTLIHDRSIRESVINEGKKTKDLYSSDSVLKCLYSILDDVSKT